MTRVVAAELLKLRTTRTFWWLAGSAVGLVVLILVLGLAIDNDARSASDVRSLLSTAGIAGLLTLVLGVVAGAGEYRHGTIASTLLVTPQRLRAVSATVMACFLGGLAIGALAAGLTAAIALPWLSTGDSVLPTAGETLELFLGGTIYAALAAGLGAALGALLRNQVAAVVIVLLLIFVVDPTVGALLEDVGQFTLTGLGVAMSGGEGESDVLPRAVAALIWVLYTVQLAALAAFFTARRDI